MTYEEVKKKLASCKYSSKKLTYSLPPTFSTFHSLSLPIPFTLPVLLPLPPCPTHSPYHPPTLSTADWPLVLGLETPLRPEQKPTVHSLLSLNDRDLRYNVVKMLLTMGIPLIKHNRYV